MRRRGLVAILLVCVACSDEPTSDSRDPGREDSRPHATTPAEPRPSAGPERSRRESSEVRTLRDRVAALEARVTDLEGRLAPGAGAAVPDGPRPPDAGGAGDGDGAAAAAAAVRRALREELDALRTTVFAGSATQDQSRRFWMMLGAEPDAFDGPSAAEAADAKPLGPDVHLSLDAPDATWTGVAAVADGARGGAASFADGAARIDAGDFPVSSAAPFTLRVHLRTRDGGFATPLMARTGEEVGLSLVMGRVTGRVSFEAWSWPWARLVSKSRVDDGAWHEIEVSYDPATEGALLFVDGRCEAAARLGSGQSLSAKLRLGNNIGSDQPFRGELDEVQILRRTTHAERFGRFR